MEKVVYIICDLDALRRARIGARTFMVTLRTENRLKGSVTNWKLLFATAKCRKH